MNRAERRKTNIKKLNAVVRRWFEIGLRWTVGALHFNSIGQIDHAKTRQESSKLTNISNIETE